MLTRWLRSSSFDMWKRWWRHSRNAFVSLDLCIANCMWLKVVFFTQKFKLMRTIWIHMHLPGERRNQTSTGRVSNFLKITRNLSGPGPRTKNFLHCGCFRRLICIIECFGAFGASFHTCVLLLCISPFRCLFLSYYWAIRHIFSAFHSFVDMHIRNAT